MKRGGVWLGVGGLVLRETGEILVVKKRYGATMGLWTLPGGFVAPGETMDEAVQREIREETGIRTRVIGVAGIRTGVLRSGESDNMVLFNMAPEKGEPAPDGVEIAEARYLSRDVLRKDPATTDLLRRIVSAEQQWEPALVRLPISLQRDYGYKSYRIFSGS